VTGDSDDSDDDDDDSDDTDSDDSDDDDSDDDDSDDDDSDDTDSDDDDSDDDSDDDDSDDDDSDDTDSDDTDSDDTDSDDDDDSDSDTDTDTDSDDTDSSDTNGSGSSSSNSTSISAVSYCASLTVNQCVNAYADDGTAICAMNANTDSCYAVVAQKGKMGSGNYDAGYTAGIAELEQESQQLNAIVGVLAAIVVLLVLALIGGAYFLHQRTKKMAQIAEESIMHETIEANDDKDVDAPMVTGHEAYNE